MEIESRAQAVTGTIALFIAGLLISGCVATLAAGTITGIGVYTTSCFVDDECLEIVGPAGDTLQKISEESQDKNKQFTDVSLSGANQLPGPGSVVTASALHGLTFRGDIRKCLINPEEVPVVEIDSKEIKARMQLTRDQFERFEMVQDAGTDSEHVKSVNLSFSRVVERRILYEVLIEALMESRPQFSVECARLLRLHNNHIVLSTLHIEGVKYELRRRFGRLISIDNETLKGYYVFDKDVNVKVEEHRILIGDPRYVAIGDYVTLRYKSGERPQDLREVLRTYNERTRASLIPIL